MNNLLIIKDLVTIVGSVTVIVIAIVTSIMWIAKRQFSKGKFYQSFNNLVQEVTYIREMVEDKFIDNDAKHRKHTDAIQGHEKRITILEVKTDAPRAKKTKRV